MSIDTGEQRVKFGDVVRNVSETVPDPVAAGLERAVGLEHLDSGELAIRRWASTRDGLTFTRRFRAGQVLFGRRRAYQRKVAIADFDGVCSGDIYVLESSGDLLMPDLLPFIVQSEPFFEYALRTSAGSLSPRTKWTDLRNFEFDLAPIGDQRAAAEALWGVETVLRKSKKIVATLDSLVVAQFADSTSGVDTTELGTFLERIDAGKSPSAVGRPAADGEFGVLKVSAVGDGVFVEEENKALIQSSDFHRPSEVRPGDLLASRANASISGVARPCIVDNVRPGLMLSDKTFRLVPNELADRRFLLLAMRMPAYRAHVRVSANGTEAKNISQNKLKKGAIPRLSVEAQAALIKKSDVISGAARTAWLQMSVLRQLRETLLSSLSSQS